GTWFSRIRRRRQLRREPGTWKWGQYDGNSKVITRAHAQCRLQFSRRYNGTTVGTAYDRFICGPPEAVAITGSNLTLHVGGTIMVGDTFLILDKTSSGAITGQFAQGTQVIADTGEVFSISYTGGNGNDVVLTFTGL